MKSILLNSESDMKWLRDVHIPDLPCYIRSAVIYGNEDSPREVRAYLSYNPLHDEEYATYLATDGPDGEYMRLAYTGGIIG